MGINNRMCITAVLCGTYSGTSNTLESSHGIHEWCLLCTDWWVVYCNSGLHYWFHQWAGHLKLSLEYELNSTVHMDNLELFNTGWPCVSMQSGNSSWNTKHGMILRLAPVSLLQHGVPHLFGLMLAGTVMTMKAPIIAPIMSFIWIMGLVHWQIGVKVYHNNVDLIHLKGIAITNIDALVCFFHQVPSGTCITFCHLLESSRTALG